MSLQDKLRQLFLLDKQVRGLRTRLNSATSRLTVQQSKLSQLTQQQEELKVQLKQTQAKASDLEGQVKESEQRIDHLRDQMQSVKSNKEYSAVLLEVNTLKDEKSKIEDEAIEQLGQIDRLKQDLDENLQRLATQQKLVDGAQADVDKSRAEIGHRLEELMVERDQAASEIPDDARTAFDRIADQHEGETMASVSEENRRHREYSCGGCYMSIPIERFNALMIQSDQIVCCPSCGRILFVDQELKASYTCK